MRGLDQFCLFNQGYIIPSAINHCQFYIHPNIKCINGYLINQHDETETLYYWFLVVNSTYAAVIGKIETKKIKVVFILSVIHQRDEL